MKLRTGILFLVIALFAGFQSSFVQKTNHVKFNGKRFYRLTTQWQGDGKSLDVINDGKNNQIHLTKTANYTGQYWKLTPVGGGYYRLTTKWQGDDKSLDVINDGKNNKLHLTKTGNFTGQYWKIEEIK